MAVLCLILSLLTETASADRHHFLNYSVTSGLPQSQVSCTFQDRQGYLWVGTEGRGVSRFDGLGFETYTTADGLTNDSVHAIIEDRQGSLWFATDAGISRFDGSAFTPMPLPGGGSLRPVRSLLLDKAGRIWIGSQQGLFRYDGQQATRMGEGTALANSAIHAIFEDRDGKLWLGTWGQGVVRYDGATFLTFDKASGLPGDHVHAIGEDAEGRLWFGTLEGTGILEGARITRADMPAGLGRAPVRSLLRAKDGAFWIGTDGAGVCSYRGGVPLCFTERDGLSSDFVRSLTEDREGNIWIGTYRGGLARYSGDRFVLRVSDHEFGADVARSIMEDRRGALWIGTFRQGLGRFDGSSFKRYTTSEGLISNFVLTVFEDRDSNVWIGTVEGVSRFDGRRFDSFDLENGLPDRMVRAIHQDAEGGIWFGTNDGGVAIYDGHNFRTVTAAEGLTDNRIGTIVGGRGGVVWVGTANGVTKFQGGAFSSFSSRTGLQARNIYSLVEDGKGYLWVGAYGEGVFRCETADGDDGAGKPRSCVSFTRKDGLVNDAVVSLAFDRRGFLWAGTESGISRLDVPRYEATGEKLFRNYGAEEGLTNIECIHNSLLADRHGDVWVGTAGGAFRYRHDQDRTNTVEPSTRITGVRLFFEETDLGRYAAGSAPRGQLPAGLRLPHDQQHITFDYLAISLSAPSKVQYRYRLDGWDRTWSAVTRSRRATYQGLPPGKYTFRVEAENGDGVWNSVPASYAFGIVAPFWASWWFMAIAAAGFGGVVFGVVKMHLNRLEKRSRLLEESVNVCTRDLRIEKTKVEAINAELENRVEARTSELARSNQELRAEIARREALEGQLVSVRNLESLGILAGGIAHDFNNLLTAIIGNISLARMYAKPGDRLLENLTRAEEVSLRAKDLIGKFILFSTGGSQPKQRIPLAPLIRESAEAELVGSSVTCEFALPDDLAQVEVDREQMGVVIRNLIGNAREAMPGGGTIEVSANNVRVDEGPESGLPLRPGKYLRVSIRDHGVGIPNERLAMIFDPYFTTKRTSTTKGVGLGLAIIHSIIQRHDGHVDVTSEPGVGSCFSVYLPAAPDVAEGERGTGNGFPDRKRILVGADDEVTRDITRQMLLHLGHEAAAAANGDELLKAYRKARESGRQFDAVILDLIVPGGMGGKETLRRLLSIDPGVRAILLSGYSDDPAIVDFQAHGFSGVLTKPFDLHELSRVLEKSVPGH